MANSSLKEQSEAYCSPLYVVNNQEIIVSNQASARTAHTHEEGPSVY